MMETTRPPMLSKDLPGRRVDCMSLDKRPCRPTTERLSLSHAHVTVGPRNAGIRWSSPGMNSPRPQNQSHLTYMDNLGYPSAPSEATTTRAMRRESSQSDLHHSFGWVFDQGGVHCGDDAKESETKDGAPKDGGNTCFGIRLGRGDRVQPSRTASRLMAKTAIFAATPVCHLVFINYASAHGLLLLPGSEWLPGDGSCKYQASFSSQISWLDCPDPLLLLTASMAGGSLMLSYHQLNIADELQTRILIVFVCVSMIFGLCSGRTLLATVLSLLPWAIYAGLGFSDLFHAGRTHHMVREADNDGVCEKV